MYYFSIVGDELKFLNNSDIRIKVLVDLLNGPLKIRDIAKKSLLSYSSISSNIHKLCDWVENYNLSRLWEWNVWWLFCVSHLWMGIRWFPRGSLFRLQRRNLERVSCAISKAVGWITPRFLRLFSYLKTAFFNIFYFYFNYKEYI